MAKKKYICRQFQPGTNALQATMNQRVQLITVEKLGVRGGVCTKLLYSGNDPKPHKQA